MRAKAFDPENHVAHDAYASELRTFGGDVAGYVFDGVTECGLSTGGMLRDVDVGPGAFTYDDCEACAA